MSKGAAKSLVGRWGTEFHEKAYQGIHGGYFVEAEAQSLSTCYCLGREDDFRFEGFLANLMRLKSNALEDRRPSLYPFLPFAPS